MAGCLVVFSSEDYPATSVIASANSVSPAASGLAPPKTTSNKIASATTASPSAVYGWQISFLGISGGTYSTQRIRIYSDASDGFCGAAKNEQVELQQVVQRLAAIRWSLGW
jgi:hypothetical protein